jgi:hypothetical protein
LELRHAVMPGHDDVAFLYLPRNRFRSPHQQDWRAADKRPREPMPIHYEEKSDAQRQRNRRPLSRGME